MINTSKNPREMHENTLNFIIYSLITFKNNVVTLETNRNPTF